MASHDPSIDGTTAVYNAIHEADGQLYVAVANMDIFDPFEPGHMVRVIDETRPAFVCFDGNLPTSCMRAIAETCATLDIPGKYHLSEESGEMKWSC